MAIKVIGHLLQAVSKMRFSATIADLPDLGWEQQARAWPLDTDCCSQNLYPAAKLNDLLARLKQLFASIFTNHDSS